MTTTRRSFLTVTVLVMLSVTVYGVFFRFYSPSRHNGQAMVNRYSYPGQPDSLAATAKSNTDPLRNASGLKFNSSGVSQPSPQFPESQKSSRNTATQRPPQNAPQDKDQRNHSQPGGDGGGGSSGSSNSGGKPPQNPPPSKLLCINFSGRLGNQMFQYAATLGLARRLNRIPVYGGGSELTRSLQRPPSTPNAAQYQARCRVAKRQWESKCCLFEDAFVKLDPQQDYTIGQYLQSWKYFEGFEDEVKEAMRFKDSIQSRVDQTIAELRKKNPNKTLVGIHVRRGDYLKDMHIKMGYRTAPASFFKDAIAYMRKRFGGVAFFVSTDDEKWFKDSVTSGSDVTILKRGDAAGDMALLASLDHVIISVGTYSWWAGYLNRGVTVYWKDFVVPGTTIGNQFLPKGETFVYPKWIPL